MQIDAWSSQGALVPLNDNNWQHEDCFVALKKAVIQISNKLINDTYPCGNENNRHRTSQLLKGGAVQRASMQYEYCKSRLDDKLETPLFKIGSAPSMKSKACDACQDSPKYEAEDHCSVCLAFNSRAKEMLFYPCAARGCYDGCHVCSHITAFILFIRCAQRCDCNKDIFEKALPASPLKLQNCVALIEHVSFSVKGKAHDSKKSKQLK